MGSGTSGNTVLVKEYSINLYGKTNLSDIKRTYEFKETIQEGTY